MSGGDAEQMPLFHVEPTESTPGAAQAGAEAPEGALMPRTPGWALLGPSDGLWHHVASRRSDGMLTATCGRQGRYVDDAASEIMGCPACSAAAPAI